MSTDAEAKLFYGYIQPESDKELYRKIDFSRTNDTTPWRETHTKKAYGCIGGIHGYDGELRFFLAVETSLHEAEWDEVKPLTPQDFVIQPEWDEQLHQAAGYFSIDDADLHPGWYLVCLYF
jgi:hypothetical protein